MGTWAGRWMWAISIAAVVTVGCGDDDDGGGDDAGPDSGLGGSAARDGGGGMSGAGSGGRGGASGAGAGGAAGVPGLPMAMCDTAIMAETTCGGSACALVGSNAMLGTLACAVPCCLPDDSCGSRRTELTNTTECAPPAVADPDCPPFMSMGMMGGMGTMYTGCCHSSGVCGVISTIDTSCITSSMLLPGLMPGPACGDTDAGAEPDGG